MGGLFQLFWERGRDFQELGHHSLFGLLGLDSKQSWQLWVCHLANVLQRTYNKAQGPLEVESSAVLDLVGSNLFMLYPQWLCHSFKGCTLSLPSCLNMISPLCISNFLSVYCIY